MRQQFGHDPIGVLHGQVQHQGAAGGGQAGQVAVTAAVSSTYPIIPLAAGLLLFRERLSRLQVVGICVAVAGLTLVSMSSRLA